MVSAPAILPTSNTAFSAHNLFFAIMVPNSGSAKFADCYQNFQKDYPFRGKPIEAGRLHLSVYPVFTRRSFPRGKKVDAAAQAGNSIRFAPVAVTFDEALTYRNRRAAMPFVPTAREGSEAVNGVRRQLGSALSLIRGGMRYVHRPASPHVTLVWDRIIVPKQPIKPISMIAQELARVHSYIGASRYDILSRWPLARL